MGSVGQSRARTVGPNPPRGPVSVRGDVGPERARGGGPGLRRGAAA